MPFTVTPNDGRVPKQPTDLSLVSLRNYFGPVSSNNSIGLYELRPAIIGQLGHSDNPVSMNALRDKRLPDIVPNVANYTVVGLNDRSAANVSSTDTSTLANFTDGATRSYTVTFKNSITINSLSYSIPLSAPDVQPNHVKLKFSTGGESTYSFGTSTRSAGIAMPVTACSGFENTTITPYIVNTKRNGVVVDYVASPDIVTAYQSQAYSVALTVQRAFAQAAVHHHIHTYRYYISEHHHQFNSQQYDEQKHHHHSFNRTGNSDAMAYYTYDAGQGGFNQSDVAHWGWQGVSWGPVASSGYAHDFSANHDGDWIVNQHHQHWYHYNIYAVEQQYQFDQQQYHVSGALQVQGGSYLTTQLSYPTVANAGQAVPFSVSVSAVNGANKQSTIYTHGALPPN